MNLAVLKTMRGYRHTKQNLINILSAVYLSALCILFLNQITLTFMKIEGTLDYNVKQLETFKARVSSIIHLSKYTLRLCTVEKGCLELRYQIPQFVEVAIFPLSQDQQEAFQKQGVKKLMCGDQCYFFPAKAYVEQMLPICQVYPHFSLCEVFTLC